MAEKLSSEQIKGVSEKVNAERWKRRRKYAMAASLIALGAGTVIGQNPNLVKQIVTPIQEGLGNIGLSEAAVEVGERFAGVGDAEVGNFVFNADTLGEQIVNFSNTAEGKFVGMGAAAGGAAIAWDARKNEFKRNVYEQVASAAA